MTAINFVYWLRGYLELNHYYYLDKGNSPVFGQYLNQEQIKIINDHIKLVLDTEKVIQSKNLVEYLDMPSC